MRSISVNVPDNVLEAAKKNAQLAGMSVGAFLSRVIERAVSPPGNASVAEAFQIADEIGKKGPRDWKREDLYDG